MKVDPLTQIFILIFEGIRQERVYNLLDKYSDGTAYRSMILGGVKERDR